MILSELFRGGDGELFRCEKRVLLLQCLNDVRVCGELFESTGGNADGLLRCSSGAVGEGLGTLELGLLLGALELEGVEVGLRVLLLRAGLVAKVLGNTEVSGDRRLGDSSSGHGGRETVGEGDVRILERGAVREAGVRGKASGSEVSGAIGAGCN